MIDYYNNDDLGPCVQSKYPFKLFHALLQTVQQPHSPSPPRDSSVTGPRCVARYDYDSDDPGDLSFHCGDTIRLLEWEGEDWLRGELRNKQGIFPITFVEVIEELPPPQKEENPGSGKIGDGPGVHG